MTALNVAQIQSNAWPQDAIDNRLRAIAINAVREARIIFMRDDKPFLDDDARRTDMIFQLLHLATIDSVNADNEHFPVVSSFQAPRNEKLEKAGKYLAEMNWTGTSTSS